MVAVYAHGWTASQEVVDAYGSPLFYVRTEYDLARMFAINPTWRIKEQRIRALVNLPVMPQADISPQVWREIGHAVEVLR